MNKLLPLLVLITSISIKGQNNQNRASIDPSLYPFYHGVASGDPLTDRVILWTRITDDTLSTDSVEVQWRIGTDTLLTNIVNYGIGYAKASNDWTFKVDASGLQPDTWYYYDFVALQHHSLTGRTRTAPTGNIDSVRFAVVSCSNWEHGYFNAYKYMKERNDFDAVLHLGDYIYEYETGGYSANISGRENIPTNEIITLEDYRLRYGHYHLDEDLRNLHQQYPFITIWDDHESANDSYKDGAENHDPATEGSWYIRKSNATQAYHEWLPIRDPNPGSPQIYRQFEWGNLISLNMLDTRLEGRDEQVSATSSDVNDPNRSLMGPTQFAWLTNNLENSTAKWNLIGQQVMMAPLEVFGNPVNADQWDGYAYERSQLMNFIYNYSINNVVVLTGDIHTSWVNDLPIGSSYDNSTCSGSAGVEFVVTSVTSPGSPIGTGVSLIQSMNDHMQYIDLNNHGYMILDINQNRVQGDYYYMNDITTLGSGEYAATGYFVNDGEKCANMASSFTARTGGTVPFAPQTPITFSPLSISETQDMIIFGAYPNPFSDLVTIQLFLEKEQKLIIEVFDLSGKMVYQNITSILPKGVNYMQMQVDELAKGNYTLVLKSDNHKVAKKLIKY